MTPKQREALEAYNALQPAQRGIVEILSVLDRTVSRKQLVECAHAARFRAPNGKPFTLAQATHSIRDLVESDLATSVRGRIQCERRVHELIAREAARSGRFARWVEIADSLIVERKRRSKESYNYYTYSKTLLSEGIRIAVHLNEASEFQQLIAVWESKYSFDSLTSLYDRLVNNPFDAEWLASRAELIREVLLHNLVLGGTVGLKDVAHLVDFLRDLEKESDEREWHRLQIAMYDLVVGDFDRALEWSPPDGLDAQLLRGWERYARGDCEAAVTHFDSVLAGIRKETRKRDVVLPSWYEPIYVLALIGSGKSTHLSKARKYVQSARRKSGRDGPVLLALQLAADFAMGRNPDQEGLQGLKSALLWEGWPVSRLVIYTAICWLDVSAAREQFDDILRLQREAEEARHWWVAAEFHQLLVRLDPKRASRHAPAKEHRQMGSVPIFESIRDEPDWKRSLSALEQLGKEGKKRRKPRKSQSRLTWRVSGDDRPFDLRAFEQKLSKTGKWTKGRAVALKRLHNRTKLAFMTAQDAEICQAVKVTRYRSYVDYDMELDEALGALVDHPLVFREDDPSVPVEVVGSQPELRVVNRGRKMRIQLVPDPPTGRDLTAVLETPSRLKVTTFEKQHREIFSLLGKSGLAIPVGSEDEVAKAVASVSSVVNVHSDIAGGETNAKDVSADATPHFYLTPYEDGLRIEPLVQPFVGGGPTYAPGEGGEVVFAVVGRRRSRTRRDRPEEVRRFDRAVAGCPSLHHASWTAGAWILPDPLACLELVEELHLLGEAVKVRWPQGESIRIAHHASRDRFSLKIRKSRDWFKIDGDLETDSGLVIGLRELLDRIDAAEGRFLAIGEREFIALTDRFRHRVGELSAFVDRHGKGLRFHVSRAHALEAVIDGAGTVDAGRDWAARIRQFREAQALDPKLPSTLQADLRGYQREGFRWAARLAAWGAGACLADDMGLGKTLQALAVALARAPSGPALVVAPTSVCPNWIDEARRFAPTLNPLSFGHGDRGKMISGLAPYDLVVCSYGLLHQEADRLASVDWETIVLDEAQAIKNRDTMRSRAAMRLHGAFRMITTGTPIENHLGELWNLFHFINPGLLGSADSFTKRFAVPIHQAGSTELRSRLKRLIQPFVLRRTKAAVLHELPPRTEITIRVAMSKEESALYEALRQRAVGNLAQNGSQDGPGHIRILAEIMKLRRACCHPRLVAPDLDLPGSKLESFGYTAADLIASGHKALVFSQFVDHLKIVRSYLDREGIAYRYLDGSTPPRRRKQEVDAFQAGEGDLFLISLRAGGQGLNLTAADYVLHLDPWWNPAVEDQASDRAHRIGQTRPVTIYRFVMKNTIEERIVDLHASKRELATHLLEGADLSGKMSADELLALIRGD